MVHIWNSATIIRKLIELIMGQLIYSSALGAFESDRATGLKAVSRPNVLIALVVTLTAAAGWKVWPPEHQSKIRKSQQEERQGCYQHTAYQPTDCTVTS